jgi:hypothetical protein
MGLLAAVLVPIVGALGLSPQPWAEVSPVIVGNQTYLSTDYSYSATWAGDQIDVGRLVSQPEASVPWLRSYAGVFGGEDVAGHQVLFVHGENKNQIVGARPQVNTITGDRTCFSRTVDGVYEDCWRDYFAFASMMLDGRNLGPIVWPRDGYLKAGREPASHGVRHPTSIRSGRWIYLFYDDTSFRNRIVVARARGEGLGRPGTWSTWTGRGWAPSLPAGSFAHKLRARGPAGCPVLPGINYFFSVMRQDGEYVGLAQGSPTATTVATVEYVSRDLVHWRAVSRPLFESRGADAAGAWAANAVQYPRPVLPGIAIASTGAGSVEVLPVPQPVAAETPSGRAGATGGAAPWALEDLRAAQKLGPALAPRLLSQRRIERPAGVIWPSS